MDTISASDVMAWRGPQATAAYLHGRRQAEGSGASVGRLAHNLILTGTPGPICAQRCSWATKEGKEEQRELLAAYNLPEPAKVDKESTLLALAGAGVEVVTRAEWDAAHAIARRYEARWGDAMMEGKTELSASSEYYGARLTGRIDLLTSTTVVDVKVVHEADMESISRRIHREHWALQFAHYTQLVGARRPSWRVISSTEPYMTFEVALDAAGLDIACEEWSRRVAEIIAWHDAGRPITWDGGFSVVTYTEAGR